MRDSTLGQQARRRSRRQARQSLEASLKRRLDQLDREPATGLATSPPRRARAAAAAARALAHRSPTHELSPHGSTPVSKLFAASRTPSEPTTRPATRHPSRRPRPCSTGLRRRRDGPPAAAEQLEGARPPKGDFASSTRRPESGRSTVPRARDRGRRKTATPVPRTSRLPGRPDPHRAGAQQDGRGSRVLVPHGEWRTSAPPADLKCLVYYACTPRPKPRRPALAGAAPIERLVNRAGPHPRRERSASIPAVAYDRAADATRTLAVTRRQRSQGAAAPAPSSSQQHTHPRQAAQARRRRDSHHGRRLREPNKLKGVGKKVVAANRVQDTEAKPN